MRYATPATIVGFYQRLLDGVQALPGMQSAATISNLPMSGAVANESFLTEGHPIRPGEEYPSCDPHAISSEYFRTMRIPLINGRYFTSLDGPEAPRVAIIDTELARMYWPGENPLGRRLAFEGTEQAPSWRTIVGIVGSVKHYGLDAPSRGHLYYPMAQGHQPSMFLVARSRLPDSTLLPEIRQAVAAIDRNLPIYDVQTMQERVDSSLAPHRTSAGMLGIFAALALLLAAIGLYGLVAYLVVQRTAEIGVRMALGAQPGDVLRLVASDALRPSLIGAALGLLAAVMLSRWIAGLLYAVSPVDPLTYALVIAVLLSVVVVASVEPARRAIRIQPLDALRTN